MITIYNVHVGEQVCLYCAILSITYPEGASPASRPAITDVTVRGGAAIHYHPHTVQNIPFNRPAGKQETIEYS